MPTKMSVRGGLPPPISFQIQKSLNYQMGGGGGPNRDQTEGLLKSKTHCAKVDQAPKILLSNETPAL